MKILTTVNSHSIQVSDEDYIYLLGFSWFGKIENGVRRAVTCSIKDKTHQMSRMILKRRGIIFKHEVDHKDRDQFNNQFENLRPATRSQNQMNRKVQSNNITGYKGVCFDTRADKYAARITVNKYRIQLGYYLDPTEAAKAYDLAAKKYFGEFAWLNFPQT